MASRSLPNDRPSGTADPHIDGMENTRSLEFTEGRTYTFRFEYADRRPLYKDRPKSGTHILSRNITVEFTMDDGTSKRVHYEELASSWWKVDDAQKERPAQLDVLERCLADTFKSEEDYVFTRSGAWVDKMMKGIQNGDQCKGFTL